MNETGDAHGYQGYRRSGHAIRPPRLVDVASRLASVPVIARRRTASVAGVFAALFLAVGVLALAGDMNWFVRVLGVIVLIGAVVLALITWGLLNSIRVDRYADEFDAEMAAAIAEHDATCGCGESHDTDRTDIVGCGHDGAGTDCARDCSTCTLAALKS